MQNRVKEIYSKLRADNDASHIASLLVWNDAHFIQTIYYYNPVDNTRKFCIKWDESKNCRIANIPKWDGVNIYMESSNRYPDARGTYLTFEQLMNHDSNIFELMISDLEEKIRDISTNSELAAVVQDVLSKWKKFFKVSPDGKLSPEKQQGLYAELLFLKHLIQNIGPKAVYKWSGPLAESRDFYLNSDGFEIKSSSKKGDEVVISSEMQLDTTDLNGNLYLVYYSFRKSSVDGETLPKIIASIKEMLSQTQSADEDFESKLFLAGYLQEYEEQYKCMFTMQERKIFHVHDEFPRITRESAVNGISSITYSLNLDTCNEYLVCDSDVDRLLIPRP